MANTNKTHVVILTSTPSGLVYLGELDRGLRQGVTRLENAIRFTATGAKRVAAQYSGAHSVAA